MAKSLEQQTDSLANYLPPGRAFSAKNVLGSVARLLLEGLAGELVRAAGLVDEFRRETIPDETTLFLSEWESAVGIPDDCFTGQGTVDERRRDVLVKLASVGVQTARDFVALAALFGISAKVRGGSLMPGLFGSLEEARHSILVDLAGNTEVFTFTFPITFGSDSIVFIKCLFDVLKPAHTQIVYTTLP